MYEHKHEWASEEHRYGEESLDEVLARIDAAGGSVVAAWPADGHQGKFGWHSGKGVHLIVRYPKLSESVVNITFDADGIKEWSGRVPQSLAEGGSERAV